MLTLLRWLARMPLGPMHSAGGGLGWLVYALSSSYRRRLVDNVAAAGFGADVRRAAVAHAGKMVVEMPYLWLRPRDEPLGARVRLADVDASRIDAALSAGRGLVLMTPHIGAFEVCAQVYAERFGDRHPMTAMYRPARQAWLRELQRTARDRPGLLTAPASLAGIRQMMKALRRGDTVGLLPDQVPPEGMGVWAPFFGRDAYTMTLAARLAQQTGASVLLIACERLAHGRGFEVRVHLLPDELPTARARLRGSQAAMAPPPTTTDDEHQRASACVVNRAMEMLVRQHPGQYLWGYHRYKQPRRVVEAADIVEAL